MFFYALLDFETLKRHNITFEEFFNLPKVKQSVILQYRDKINNTETIKENLLLIRTFWDGILIVNDHLSLIDYTDGVHFGQEDLNYHMTKEKLQAKEFINLLKKKYPTKQIGLSTHNQQEILKANDLALDYIGLGAYRKTHTKDVGENILGSKLSKLAGYSKHPVVAIGSVRSDDKIENVDYLAINSDLYKGTTI